jgi:ABC-type Fe3+/spermidine/putrescine transport system ATPase subunit
MNDGVIEQMAPPREIYRQPATPFVHGFIGSSLSFAGHTVAHPGGQGVDIGGAILPLGPSRHEVGTRVVASIRPEDVEVEVADGEAPQNKVRGRVEQVFFLGDRLELAVRVGEHRLVLTAPAYFPVHAEGAVNLAFPPDRVRIWPAASNTSDGEPHGDSDHARH